MKTLLLTVAPMIAMVAITLSYLPQLKMTYKTKDVSGQAVGFWMLLTVALVGTTAQQLGTVLFEGVRNYSGLITQSVNLLFSSIMLFMVTKYRNKGEK